MNLSAIVIIGSLGILAIAALIFIHLRDQKLLKTVTKPYRGTQSERKMVLTLLKRRIPAQTIFHDLYLRNSNGRYSQMDLVVVTKVGIIVFEIKEYSGWIFGTGNQREWTQVLAYGNQKFRFYNPIFQNKKHITDLIHQLPQFEKIPFYSVIVFFGNCKFRDLKLIPDDVFLIKSWQVDNVLEQILQANPQAQYTDKREVVNLLNAAVQNGENSEICEEHIRNIQAMRGRYR
ncbi:MAG: nuclease-related domain-containing protein [Pseudobacter sp.]|uniref:nuclease-related domain-containing protein n=1 Tax=Pseudobacter sp. TaxID=2045420 RepID=UPI003F7F296E